MKIYCHLLYVEVVQWLQEIHIDVPVGKSKYVIKISAELAANGLFLHLSMSTNCPVFPLFVFHICRSLQRTLNELKEYQKQHDHYLRQQEALDKHKLLQEEQILRNIIHETQMAKEAQLGEMPHTGIKQEQNRKENI